MNQLIGIGVLVLAIIGNTSLWIVMVNRRHSYSLPEWRLKGSRLLHDIGILLIPVLLVWYVGLGNGGLLTGGTLAQQSLFVQGMLAVAISGVIPFVGTVVRWQCRQTPAVVVRQDSSRFDVLALAADDRKSAVSGRRSRLLARVPGNEIYRLEATDAHLDLARRHAAAAGKQPPPTVATPDLGSALKLAHFSDMHLVGCPGRGYFEFVVDQLCQWQPDAFLFTGDLIDDMNLLPWATDFFSRLAEVAPGYFVLGNHDWQQDHQAIRAAIVAAGWVSLAGRSEHIALNGTPVLLAGSEMPWIKPSPVVPSRSNECVRILLSHSPDERDFALKNDFDLLLAGHNHGGQVALPVIGPVYSPSRHGVRYAGGTYQHGSLVIHVSRGVGAKDPLRWNCLPEVTLFRVSGFPSNRDGVGTTTSAARLTTGNEFPHSDRAVFDRH